jgi:DNA-binding MarR family transcriptional regulator
MSGAGDADETALDPVLQFMRLLWAVHHGLQRASKRMRRQLQVTGPQRLVLRVIGQIPGISAGSVARLLHVHPSTLTGVLARLQTRGLIARQPDPADRRRSILVLTAAGAAIDRRHAGTVEAAVRKALATLAPAQQTATRRVLTRLVDSLDAEAAPHGRRPSHVARRVPKRQTKGRSRLQQK